MTNTARSFVTDRDGAQRTNDLGQPIGPAISKWTPPPRPTGESLSGSWCSLKRFDLERHADELFEAYRQDDEGRNWTYLGYRRYEWKCVALNGSSRNAASRLGFAHEGTFRQSVIYKGRNRDSAWYSIIDPEWPALRDLVRDALVSVRNG